LIGSAPQSFAEISGSDAGNGEHSMTEFDKAFKAMISASVNLGLVERCTANGSRMAVLQAQGNVEGTVEFLTREMGAEAAYEFFARIADGIVQSIPHQEKADGKTEERKGGGPSRPGEAGEGSAQGEG
jgi:hypothetical protein